jgi:hypothetical protein
MTNAKLFQIIVFVTSLCLLPSIVFATILEVTQPVQVTDNSYYERGQAIVYDGSYYWLFYGRSATVTGNYQNDNPDVHDYQIYYKKATTVEGLASAAAMSVPGAANTYLGEIGAAVLDGKVWTFGAVPSTNYTGRKSLYGWYSSDGGSSWTQVADLVDDLPPGAAHHDETAFDGKLYIMANYPDGNTGWYTKYTADPTASTITWSSYIPLNSTSNLINGTGHFFVDGSNLYIGILRTSPTKDNKVLQYNASPESWSELGTASSSGWDATLFKAGSDYVFAQAPYTSEGGGRQYIIAWAGSSPSTVLSGSSHNVVEGRYGTNTWIDMWPIGFTDAGGTSYLFYTSEREDPDQEGTGNIWYLEVDWDVYGDHYTYIQEAVDAITTKSTADTVSISAGTFAAYDRALAVIDVPMTLMGAGQSDDGSGTVLDGGTYGQGVDNTGLGTSWPRAIVIQSDDVILKNMRIRDYQGDQTTTGGYAIVARAESSWGVTDPTIDNLVIEDITFDDCYYGVREKNVVDALVQNTTYLINTGAPSYAVYITNSTGTTVRANTFDQAPIWVTDATYGTIGGPNPSDGNVLTNIIYNGIWYGQQFASGTSSEKGLIQNNTVSGAVEGGIVVWNWPGETADSIRILDNTVTGAAGGSDNHGGISIRQGIFTNMVISGNSSTNNADDQPGLLVSASVATSVEVSNNVFADNPGNGITLYNVTRGDLKINGNKITGNSSGLAMTLGTTTTLDASGNYWGSTSPATVAGMVTGNVDYTPWLGGGTDNAPGFSGDFSELWVDDDSPQSGTSNRIQEGVDLVTASTVNIAAGTYDATIDIDTRTDVNLVGADKTTTIVKPSTTLPWGFSPYGTSRQAALRVYNSTGIDVSNLTFDYDLIKGNSIFGVLYWDSEGSLSNNIFKNISAADSSGYYYEMIAYMRAPGYTDAARAQISITDNTFAETGRIALVTHDYLHTVISGNTFYKTISDFGYAMEIGSQSTSVVSNNTIYGYNTMAASDSSNSAGIYIENAFTGGSPSVTKNVTLSGNEIYDCQWGLYIGNEFDTYAGDVDIVANVTGNNIHDNTDGGVVLTDEDYSAGSSVDVTFQNNTVMSNGSYGYLIFTNGDGDITALLNNETIVDQDTGIYINDYTTGSSVYDVDIYGNSLYNGLNAECNVSGVSWDDGTGVGNCWSDWATNSGYPTQYNIGGTPGGVDNYPSVDCGLDMTPDDILYHCSGDFTFDIEIGEAVVGLDAANVTVRYPADLNFVSATEASGNYQLFYNEFDNATGYDSVQFNFGVLTGSEDGPITLFSVTMNGTTDYCTGDLIENTYVLLQGHDPLNNIITIPASKAEPITVVADCADPVLSVSTADGGYYNIPPVVNFGATDNCDLDAIYYQVDGCASGGWTAIATGLTGTAYGPSDWTLPTADWSGLSEAQHCIRFKVMDDNERGNSDSCSYTWCFTKDITAPPAPTDLVAQPGHNKVELNWTNAGSDFDHTVIVRNDYAAGGGHGYPEYDDLYTEASYPADTSDGDYIYAGTAESHTDSYNIDNANRDVYHFAAFTVDAAGNYSAPTAASQARSTSYWLGDFSAPYDGNVYFTDLSVFSNAYGTSDGDTYYNNECDIGPTFNANTRGIPQTDNTIGFDDLTIFVINFDDVSPLIKSRPIFSDNPEMPGTGIRADARFDGNSCYVDVFLDNGNHNAKAVFAEISYDSKRLSYHATTFNPQLTEADRPVFTKPLQEKDKVSVSAAVLGKDQVFDGSGLIATIQFNVLTLGEAELTLSDADIRDNRNNKLLGDGFISEPIAAAAALPDRYELSQNHPNPFNPETEISYSLPEETWVTINVYNISGQLVKTLVDDVKPAGRHTVSWNGTNQSNSRVATGVYFYRMETEEFQKTAKMILVK